MAWDSEQYLKFATERKQPCLDLISRLNGNYLHILDLGCGPGNSTANLKSRYPEANIIGFDSDENMLERARTDHPDIQKFVHGFAPDDLGKLTEKYDLIFSNACIQWIPDQLKLITYVADLLCEGGTFAVQIPITAESDFYRLLYRLIDEKWQKLANISKFYALDHTGYYNALIKHFGDVTIWQTNYHHIVDSKSMVIEWYKGSGLRPYLNALPESEQTEFLRDLTDEINKEYRLLDDGNLFLVMPRLFFLAKK